MASSGFAPAWQTEELGEEWVEQSMSSARTGSSSSGSQSTPSSTTHKSFDSTKHAVRSAHQDKGPGGMRIVSGHTTYPSPHAPSGLVLQHPSKRQSSINVTYDAAPSPPTSHRSGSVSSGSGSSLTAPQPADRSIAGSTMPAGTFLVKPADDANPNDDALAAGLKRNPFLGGGGDIGGGEGDGLFQRLELERMFDPPRAPVEPVTTQLAEREIIQKTESAKTTASPMTHNESTRSIRQDPEVPFRRTSHSYVPMRPSRLSNSMTPPSANNSMSSSSATSVGDVSAGIIREGSVLQYGSSPREEAAEELEQSEYDSQSDSSDDQDSYRQSDAIRRRTTMRRFSGQEGSMRDVEFTFSPSPIRKRPSAQTLVTHTSRSVSSSVSPTSGEQTGKKKPPFRLFQRHVDTAGYDSIQTRDLIEQITVGGTPLKDLVNRAGSGVGIGSPSPVGRNSSTRLRRYTSASKARIDSGFSRAPTDTSSRRKQRQLNTQWSTSSGSGEGSSGSFVTGHVEEESELEERSSKRIRLSESPSTSTEHVYQHSAEYEEDYRDASRYANAGDVEYEYSASGSEDAREQRSIATALSASQSRISRTNGHPSARRDQSFQHSAEASSASEVQEDFVNGQQIQRRSWNEKGQELLERIRQVGTSEKSDSWNSWSRSSTDERRAEEDRIGQEKEGVPNDAQQPGLDRPEPQIQYGTVTSSNSGGTASSSNTITSRYLSAGINMLEKIKERKVSDSSGTGAYTDGDAKTEVQGPRRGAAKEDQQGQTGMPRPIHFDERSNDSTRLATASSQSTIRGIPKAGLQISAAGSRETNGTVKSGLSTSSSRSSYVASLGKGAAPATYLRTIAEMSAASIGFGQTERGVQEIDRDSHEVSHLPRSQHEDMNRQISSTSTAASATAAASASSVKHRGPPPPTPHGRAQGVRTIGLNDIPQIPRQVGNMVFDPVRGWVRASKASHNQADREASPLSGAEGKSSSAESVDIFAGMESLRDEEGTPQPESSLGNGPLRRRAQNLSPVLEMSMSQGLQEGILAPEVEPMETAFPGDDLTRQIASTSPRSLPPQQESGQTDSPLRDLASLSIMEKPAEDTSDLPQNLYETRQEEEATPKRPVLQRPELREYASAPTPLQTDPLQSTPAVRSILKTGTTEMSAIKTGKAPATPISAIKNAPDDSARRSVSFSDGRTYGKIKGEAARSARQANGAARKQRNWSALAPEDDIFNSQDGSSSGEQGLLPMQPSVRSKRIQNMLTDLSQNASETPSKTVNSGHSRKLSLLSEPSPNSVTDHAQSESSFNSRVRRARQSQPDATFLTECSFGVAHDRLVELITEVQPYEPHWEELTKIDLSKRGVDSVARLKEFCPDLDEANLNNNHISYLSGLPTSLRRLHVSFNKLTNVSSVDYLANLQYLDVSHNQIDSVNALSCLRHLRELRLDNNQVQDLKDIMTIDSLVKLSCKGNAIKAIDLSSAQWTNMECLDLSRNQISHVEGLENLSSLTTLNLDHNRLAECAPSAQMQSLRALRLSHNRLGTVDMSKFPRLRSLYADSNRIQMLTRSKKQTPIRLEYLSLRDQDVYDLSLSYDDLRDVKRLYVSGNHLSADFFPARPLYSLVYLEAAACSLSEWPENFARRLPNIRILNMNYNFLEDLSGLEGLQGLRKLMMIGCRLGEDRSSSVMRSVRQIGTLEEIDLRMNPLNSNFYLPLILNETSPTTIIYPADANSSEGEPHPSSSIDKWAGMDDKFRQLLPDKWYFKRLVYRGAVKLACETVEVIDGIQLTHGEMRKAIELMEDAAIRGKTAV